MNRNRGRSGVRYANLSEMSFEERAKAMGYWEDLDKYKDRFYTEKKAERRMVLCMYTDLGTPIRTHIVL